MAIPPHPHSGLLRLLGNLLAIAIFLILAEAAWVWFGNAPFLACMAAPVMATALPVGGFLIGIAGIILFLVSGFRDMRGLGIAIAGVIIFELRGPVLDRLVTACG